MYVCIECMYYVHDPVNSAIYQDLSDNLAEAGGAAGFSWEHCPTTTYVDVDVDVDIDVDGYGSRTEKPMMLKLKLI